MTGNGDSLAVAGGFAKTMLVVGVAILAIFFLDTLLAKSEMAESQAEAARAYAAGRAAMQEGKNAAAADHFKSAIAAQRANPEYHLALAQALLAADELAGAQDELNGMLLSNPGLAHNLAMARVLNKEGRFSDSAIYYHRAIYGQWKEDPRGNQVKARFELTDLLSKEGSREALLAELLPLENDAPDDAATRKKLGNLLLPQDRRHEQRKYSGDCRKQTGTTLKYMQGWARPSLRGEITVPRRQNLPRHYD